MTQNTSICRESRAQVIVDAIPDGASRNPWERARFAYADYHDAAGDRYPGIEVGRRPNVQLNANSVVVKPAAAAAQIREGFCPTSNLRDRRPHGGRPWNRGGHGNRWASGQGFGRWRPATEDASSPPFPRRCQDRCDPAVARC